MGILKLAELHSPWLLVKHFSVLCYFMLLINKLEFVFEYIVFIGLSISVNWVIGRTSDL